MRKLDYFLIAAQNRALKVKEDIKNFYTGEEGVSNVVATIIILLIVVLLIGIFWGRLQTWLEGLMDQIFGSSFGTENMDVTD